MSPAQAPLGGVYTTVTSEGTAGATSTKESTTATTAGAEPSTTGLTASGASGGSATGPLPSLFTSGGTIYEAAAETSTRGAGAQAGVGVSSVADRKGEGVGWRCGGVGKGVVGVSVSVLLCLGGVMVWL